MSTGGDQWIGVLGGGQLGRMLSLDARRMGFKVLTWTGGDRSGAAAIADELLDLPFDDPKALEIFTSRVKVATVEFENLPSDTLEEVEQRIPLYPNSLTVTTCQHREREKSFLSENGFACAPFRIACDLHSFKAGIAELKTDVIVKTAEFGYDGKGQLKLSGDSKDSILEKAWLKFDGGRVVIEECISLDVELSVIVARNAMGEVVCYDPVENIHRNHILDISIVPARIPEEILQQAETVALAIADAFQYVGTLAVEFFLSSDGRLIVNEIAPRPHNSGHHTINACSCSQFENQIRAIMGLPLGSTDLLSPVVMMNLLGDVWPDARTAPDWSNILSMSGTSLHVYGKREARIGRKMGHVSFLGTDQDEVLQKVNIAREFLKLPKL
jgi:5-(carboxyamino)imidazole ribonucleotide synthase